MNLKDMQVVPEDVFVAFVDPAWSFKYEFVTDPSTGKYCALHTGYGPLSHNGIITIKAVVQRLIDPNGVMSRSCLYMISTTHKPTTVKEVIEELL